MLRLLSLLLSVAVQKAPAPPAAPKNSPPAAAPANATHYSVQWEPAKTLYVKERVADPILAMNLSLAEVSTKAWLSPQARTAVTTDYAAAEYEVMKLDASYPIVSFQTQQKKVLADYLIMATSDADEEAGFRFRTYSTTTLFARSTAKYGKLKITLNPPTKTFTVTVGSDTYDSKDTIVLLAATYDVVVDRTNDKCKGKVTIQERRTSQFPCR